MKRVKLVFNGSYATIYETSSYKLKLVKKYMEEFSRFGLTTEEVETTKKMLESFNKLKSDKSMLFTQVNKRLEREQLVVKLKQEIETFIGIVKFNLLPTEEENAFSTFNIKGLSKLKSSELVLVSEKISEMYEQNRDLIRNGNLVENYIQNFRNISFEIMEHTDNYNVIKGVRNQATDIRLELANKIIKRITKYCEIGKTIFKYSDKALYNQFVFYKTTQRKSKPQNL